jgi:hypothetical protein
MRLSQQFAEGVCCDNAKKRSALATLHIGCVLLQPFKIIITTYDQLKRLLFR